MVTWHESLELRFQYFGLHRLGPSFTWSLNRSTHWTLSLIHSIQLQVIEAIQSRCAILRYTRLDDLQIAKRVQEVADMEKITVTDKGLEAIIFTAEGDMRNALNALQATNAGFGLVSDVNVFRVCDQPHPVAIQKMVAACVNGDIDTATGLMSVVFKDGFAVTDIVGTLFKVIKGFDMPEDLKLEYMKELGKTHLRIAAGLTSKLQLDGLLGSLASLNPNATGAKPTATKQSGSGSSSGGGGGR